MGTLSGRPANQKVVNPTPQSRYAISESSGVDRWIEHGDLSAAIRAAITIADMPASPAQTIIGNNSSVSAKATALTASQIRAIINVANGATANLPDAQLLDLENATGLLDVTKINGLTWGAANIWVNSVTLNQLRFASGGALLPLSFAANSSHSAGYRYVIAPDSGGAAATGVVSIISGPIDIDEGEQSTVVLDRVDGASGAITIGWTVTAGLTTVASGSVSWGNNEPGQKTFTITGAEQAADADGTLTISVTLGSVGLGTDQVTVDVRHIAPQTPGIITIAGVNGNFPVGPSGSTYSFVCSRIGGSDGDIAVDWETTVPGITTPDRGTLYWEPGDSTDNQRNIITNYVSEPTVGTIRLLNPRRIDGGSPQPTLGAVTTANFGIQPPAGAGSVGLTGGNITVSENTPIPIVVTHTGESGVVRTVRWTIGNASANQLTGILTWNVGETGPKSPDPLPVAGFVLNDNTAGTIGLSELSAGSLGVQQIGLTVRDVPQGGVYTLDDLAERFTVPFAYSEPVLPTILRDRNVTPATIGSFINEAGSRLILAPSATSYGNLTLSALNQEIVITTGVTVGDIQINQPARYVRLTASPARSGLIRRINIGQSTGAVPKDITIDGIRQEYMDAAQYDNFTDRQSFNVQRLAILNSQFKIRGWHFVAYPGAEQTTDIIIANNLWFDAGWTDLGGRTDPGAAFRMQGASRVVFVDNNSYANYTEPFLSPGGGPRFHFRFHSDAIGTNNGDLYIAKNLFVGTNHALQRTGDGATTIGTLTNLHYVDNTQYCMYQQPINTGPTIYHWPNEMTIQDNVLYSQQNYPTSVPSGSSGLDWTLSPNEWNQTTYEQVVALGEAAHAAWTFDTWKNTGGGGGGSSSYTLANAISGVPFSVSLPASPVITTTVDVTPANIASFIGLSGRRLRLGAGNYGRLNIKVPDIELVLTTGVNVEEILVGYEGPRFRCTANPIRSGRIGCFTVGTSDEGTVSNGGTIVLSTPGNIPQDVTFDGVTVDWFSPARKSNYGVCNRFALINSYVKQVVSTFICWGIGYPTLPQNLIIANNNMIQQYNYDSIGGNNGFGLRTQGVSNLIFVDNRLYSEPVNQAAPWSLRVHGNNTANGGDGIARNHFYSRNQTEGTAWGVQRVGDAQDVPLANRGNLDNVRFINNRLYFAVTSMPAIAFGGDSGIIPQSGGLYVQGNQVYGPQGITIPSGYNYNASGNTQSAYVTPPPWNFL